MKRTFGLILTLCTSLAMACIHPPATYEGSHSESSQEAIVFWHDSHEELIIKVAYEFHPTKGSAAPEYLAWVVPLPTAPDAYQEADPDIFPAMFNAWQARLPKIRSDTPVDRGPRMIEKSVFELLKKEIVGDYEIQPIKAKGVEGGKALNVWLETNGFSKVPEANMAYYINLDWVWLAIKGHPPKGETQLPLKGALRPLQMSFVTPEIVYPLKFSSHQGVFNLSLYVITEKALPAIAGKKSLPEFKLQVASYGKFALPKIVKQVLLKTLPPAHKKILKKPVVTLITGERVNDKNNRLSTWTHDLAIKPAGSKK